MKLGKDVDEDILEGRGGLIDSLRQQPDYLAMKYNEKIRKEKEKAMKRNENKKIVVEKKNKKIVEEKKVEVE